MMTDVVQVEHVTLWRQGVRLEGNLHLTPHHIIYTYHPLDSTAVSSSPRKAGKSQTREVWITYPMVSYCTYRSGRSSAAAQQSPSIRLRCRDFAFVAFHFRTEKAAQDVFDSIRSLTCKLGRIEKFYAFSYRPQAPERETNGWDVYDAKREWRRMGISSKEADRGWRVTEINRDYQVPRASQNLERRDLLVSMLTRFYW